MHSASARKAQTITRLILRWYRLHSRTLPWRKTDDPYEILVSEVMLQQTQASRVKEKLPQFLKKFPTLNKLAAASRADVIRAWQGMGYNKRAVRLHDLANIVVRKFNGRIPSDRLQLSELPGIGRYTAHAIECFAFNKKVPVVDVNVRRVLSRLFYKMRSTNTVLDESSTWTLAARILPRDPQTWNHALMDFGATICKAVKPLCSDCPVTPLCSSRYLQKKIIRATRNISEPSYAGVPRRIWRGRVVQTLRTLKKTESVTVLALGKKIKKDFNRSEFLWLKEIIFSLTVDGLIEKVASHRIRLAH